MIQAPLAPCVVIAGAGSGKTETMAARVVWLIANRMVAPDQVLGLTFTRKAAAELAGRVRHRLAQWRRGRRAKRPTMTPAIWPQLLAGEPTVLTYSAYAGRLVGEHALRLGREPSPRLLSQAVRWQLADSVVRRYGGELPVDIGALASVTQYVLGLADQLADHLAYSRRRRRRSLLRRSPTGTACRRDPARSATPKATAGYVKAQRDRLALLPLVRAFESAKQSSSGGVDYGDQMALAAALAQVPDVAVAERSRYCGGAARRVSGHRARSGHAAGGSVRPGASGHGGRRSAPVDLRLAGRRRGEHRPVRVDVPARRWRRRRPCSRWPPAGATTSESWPQRTSSHAACRRRPARRSQAAGPCPAPHPGRILATMTPTVEDEAAWLARRLGDEWRARPAGGRTAAVLVRRRSADTAACARRCCEPGCRSRSSAWAGCSRRRRSWTSWRPCAFWPTTDPGRHWPGC